MAVIGDVVWLNSGQGPYTVVGAEGEQVVLSQGNPSGLQTIPSICVTTVNPQPQLDADREANRAEIAAKIEAAKTPVVVVSS